MVPATASGTHKTWKLPDLHLDSPCMGCIFNAGRGGRRETVGAAAGVATEWSLIRESEERWFPMRKTLPVLVGLAGALMVSASAEAALTGIKSVVKSAPGARLFIVNLYVTFSAPGDNLIAIVGLPAPGAPLSYTTNGVNGFHQEVLPLGPQDVPLNSILFGIAPNYADDTYITIGLKHGYLGADTMQHVGVLATDIPPGATNWNAGQGLTSNAAAGGSYFVLPGAPQGVEIGLQVLIAQLVVDTNRLTTDGLAHRIDIFVPEITWADNLGNSQSTTGLFSITRIVPAPGTLALLGLAGLAGIRRRRR